MHLCAITTCQFANAHISRRNFQKTMRRSLCSFSTTSFGLGMMLTTSCRRLGTQIRRHLRSIYLTVLPLINATGAKTATINTTGNEKNWFTVMLACTADGGKLPPFVIFKRKTLPKNVIWPEGILIRCQDKGWMDDTLTKRSLLVLDSFRCHKSDDIREVTIEQDWLSFQGA